MLSEITESLHPDATGLDALPGQDVLRILLTAQSAAVAAVGEALPMIEAGAALMARTIGSGGRLIYAGAGSSALMANADGLELPGTFGIDPDKIVLLMAGGLPQDARMPGATEDDAVRAAEDAAILTGNDLVIAVTASGNTPYPMAIARCARAKGAEVIAIANNQGAAIFELANVAICLPTPPEVIAGSTRMGAGSAQKTALNMMSTLMGIRLGQVYDGMMVGLVADNDKLRDRARRMVRAISQASPALVDAALAQNGGAVKPAALQAAGAAPGEARELLTRHQGNLRAALALLKTTGCDQPHETNQGSKK